MSQPVNCLKMYHWMWVKRFWSNSYMKQQKHECYMIVLMNPLDNLLTIRPIWMVWEQSIKPYPNLQFGCNVSSESIFEDSLGLTQSETQSGGPEPLLTLSREVLCRETSCQKWSRWQFKCSRSIIFKESLGWFDDIFHVQNVSYCCHLHISSSRFCLHSM